MCLGEGGWRGRWRGLAVAKQIGVLILFSLFLKSLPGFAGPYDCERLLKALVAAGTRGGDTFLAPVEPKESPSKPLDSMGALAQPISKGGELAWSSALTLAKISNLAYEDGKKLTEPVKSLGATQVRQITKGRSYGVVASNDQAVVVGFRGTSKAVDWLTNGKIIGRRVNNGEMHAGFYEAVAAIYKQVFNESMRQGGDKKPLWVTGHSLGGAMAAVFAYRILIEKGLNPSGVVTFGQPLLFSEKLAQVMLDHFDTRYVRFVNAWDPITRLLPNYEHAGERIHLTNNGFTVRKPMLALSLRPGDPSSHHLIFSEDDEGLQTMSEAEFQQFLQQLKDAQAEPGPVQGTSVGLLNKLPFLHAHSMDTYVERVESNGKKNPK